MQQGRHRPLPTNQPVKNLIELEPQGPVANDPLSSGASKDLKNATKMGKGKSEQSTNKKL